MIDAIELYNQQLSNWEEFRERVNALDSVALKTLDCGTFSICAQFNAARAISSNAKLDPKTIAERKCFLCEENRPPIQRGLPLNDRFTLCVNPFPILKGHLTIICKEHRNQEILPFISDFIELTRKLPDFTLLYNGPASGASAPDHQHFQAVYKGQMPFEKDLKSVKKKVLSENIPSSTKMIPYGKMEQWQDYGRTVIHIESETESLTESYFKQIYKQYQLLINTEAEPPLNLFGFYENGMYHLFYFPRKKHRPKCFFAQGEDFKMISPGAIDIAGIFVLPREKDFSDITPELIKAVLEEVAY